MFYFVYICLEKKRKTVLAAAYWLLFIIWPNIDGPVWIFGCVPFGIGEPKNGLLLKFVFIFGDTICSFGLVLGCGAVKLFVFGCD